MLCNFFISTSCSDCLTLNEVTRIPYYLVLTLLVSESRLCAEHGDGAKRGGRVWSLNPGAFLTSCLPWSQVIRLPQVAWEQIGIRIFQYSCKIQCNTHTGSSKCLLHRSLICDWLAMLFLPSLLGFMLSVYKTQFLRSNFSIFTQRKHHFSISDTCLLSL